MVKKEAQSSSGGQELGAVVQEAEQRAVEVGLAVS